MDSSSAGVRIAVRVRPGAPKAAVGGRYGERALKVAVPARPVDGQANRAVVDAVAAAFGVRRAAVRLVTGERSRDKTLFVAGDPGVLQSRLAALLEP